ncbi:hypothetical protein B0H13DRAFT_2653892 [Mycena leptocephala]|nr:hypothetical protein B0H13DRAFT_2653892 [Mycena leptocephala]
MLHPTRQSLHVPLPRFHFRRRRRLSLDLDAMHVQQASSILLVCCTQFELILRPRSDRFSNNASICPRRSPTPTQCKPPTHTVPRCRRRQSIPPSQTDANTEYTTSDWPSYRARRPPFPSTPLSAARPRILRAVLRIAWASRRCTIMASPPLNDEPAPYLHALRRCACASCNRDCRFSTLYRASDVRATAPTPRVRRLALSLSPARISFSGSVNLFFEHLSWSPFTCFPPSLPGIIPRRC